jgi:hypothetical protein
MADVVSLLLRPVMEGMLCSLYAALGGPAAADHLRGAHVREVSKLPPDLRANTMADVLIDNWTGPTDPINWEDLTRTVGRLVEERFPLEGGARQILNSMYGGIYRTGSMLATHSTVGSFGGHLRPGEVVEIAPQRYSPDDGTTPFLMAASLLGTTAQFLYRLYGVSALRLDPVLRRVHAGLNAESFVADLPSPEPSP